MRRLMVLVALVSMSVSNAAVAHAASQVFPFAEQYDASYTVTQGSNTWTAAIQFAGTASLQGEQWFTMEQTNWNGDGSNLSMDVRDTGPAAKAPDTPNTFYYYDATQLGATDPYSVPLFKKGSKGTTWTYTDTQGNTVTALIQSVGNLKVPAGNYSGVYQVLYTDGAAPVHVNKTTWWAPGVGLIQETDNLPSSGSGPSGRS